MLDLRRRQLITLLAGAAAAWPSAARAQQPAMPIVGFVSGMSSSASERQAAAFLKGLSETGYLEDQNVAVEDHWLNGQYYQLPITYG
jgi:putative ABC transport system substrate-binding protein